MQNTAYPWVSSSSLNQKSWPPGYQASLTDLFLKKNPLHFGTGISQLAAASTYIEKMSTFNERTHKCPHPDAKDKPYPCEICQQYFALCDNVRRDNNSCTSARLAGTSGSLNQCPTMQERKPLNLASPTIPMDNRPPQNLPVTSSSMANRPRAPSNKQFICPVCHKYFTQKGNLKTHMMIHTGEKPYSCNICGKCFTQKGNVDTHMKIHTGEKEFGCDNCGKRFTQKGNLKTHVRSVHTKEKPFACTFCGKSFSQKGNMQTHMRTHNKDDRFPCTLCGKTFSQKGNLKTHIQRHTGQLPSRRNYASRGGSNHPPNSGIRRLSSQLPQYPNSQSSPSQSMAPNLSSPMATANDSKLDQQNLQLSVPTSRSLMGVPYGDLSQNEYKTLDSPMSPLHPTPRIPPINQLQRQHSISPSSHPSQISSPSPIGEMHSSPPVVLHNKVPRAQNSQTPNHQMGNDPLSPNSIHSPPPHVSQPRISSSPPLACPSDLSNTNPDSRAFYSAPSTPIPTPIAPSPRWLPHSHIARSHYDTFLPHSGLSSYNPISQHTTPLSRLSLFASSSMPHPNSELHQNDSKHDNSPTLHTQHLHNSHQYHPSGSPDFTQLLD
ncbi:uncharacterized protein [Centruroides vittatus]|uniref:uncharacterized protein n=1 Tax=Centruroides vittatus TaxID=120091 RepID=UPI0035109893